MLVGTISMEDEMGKEHCHEEYMTGPVALRPCGVVTRNIMKGPVVALCPCDVAWYSGITRTPMWRGNVMTRTSACSSGITPAAPMWRGKN